MASSCKECLICHRVAADIASAIGLCPSWCRASPPAARLQAEAPHRDTRAAFDLPATPPHDSDGIRCRLCSNECVIGEEGYGYCGLRTVRQGKLIHLAGTPERGLLEMWFKSAFVRVTARHVDTP